MVAVISQVQPLRECDELLDAVDRTRGDDAALIQALRACAAHPCAYHRLDLPELYGELAERLGHLGRTDEALDAWEAAIAAGYRSAPHPRANVAEVLVRARRWKEAAALFADLRRKCPEDVWLRNSVGLTYAEAGDHTSALNWLDEGVAMALADGDGERILDQLNEQRNRSREAEGLPPDDFAARADAFDRADPSRSRLPGARAPGRRPSRTPPRARTAGGTLRIRPAPPRPRKTGNGSPSSADGPRRR